MFPVIQSSLGSSNKIQDSEVVQVCQCSGKEISITENVVTILMSVF